MKNDLIVIDWPTKLFANLVVTHFYSTVYHPQTNGQIERFNTTMDGKIAALCNERRTDWDEVLQFVTFNYNTSIHATTKQTPWNKKNKQPKRPQRGSNPPRETNKTFLRAKKKQAAKKPTAGVEPATRNQQNNPLRRKKQRGKNPKKEDEHAPSEQQDNPVVKKEHGGKKPTKQE